MVVLAASICTRGGKAVLCRQFIEMPRTRIEALLAAFPKLTDTGTQHTTVEGDNVRYVYQPLDDLFMVLITNKQSNILQDIDSLHLFAQVITSICKSTDEREILKNAFQLLEAFDEVVNLGYKENLTLPQVKTFLEMESHEERIQEIISRNKELEASEDRKRKAKQLEMQRREMQKSGRVAGGMGSQSSMSMSSQFQTYQPPARNVPDSYDAYEAEKNKTYNKPTTALKGKGMQLGKKSKTSDMFEKVRSELGPEAEMEPLVPAPGPAASAAVASPRASLSTDRDAIHLTVQEQITAELSREGGVSSCEVKGTLELRISDPSMSKCKLKLSGADMPGAQFRTHPKVDKALFSSDKVIMVKDANRAFPANNQPLGVLRWRVAPPSDKASALVPLLFTVWLNRGTDSYTATVEYELSGSDSLKDVVVSIPFARGEPVVTSYDAVYEVAGDGLDWNIPAIDEDNSQGSFEFEAQADDESEFFPMTVRFRRESLAVNVTIDDVQLVDMDESVSFSQEIKSVTESYQII